MVNIVSDGRFINTISEIQLSTNIFKQKQSIVNVDLNNHSFENNNMSYVYYRR